MVVAFICTIRVTGLLHLTADGNGNDRFDYCKNSIHLDTLLRVQHVLHNIKNGVKSYFSGLNIVQMACDIVAITFKLCMSPRALFIGAVAGWWCLLLSYGQCLLL